MRKAARSPAIVIAVVIAGGAAACSVVSGWQDLQGGTRKPSGSSGSSGEGGPSREDGGSSGDTGVDAVAPVTGVTCGAARCTKSNEGCCHNFDGTKQCSSQTTCADNGGEWLTCTSPAQCPTAAPICCYQLAAQTSSCLAGCGFAVGAPLCDPTEPSPCPGGQACTKSVPGAQSLRSCK